jgi:hypothetical protein
MIYKEFQGSDEYFHDAVPFIMEGQVLSTADPDQMGRCKVWVPALDGENFDIQHLPWADYASPFFGFTVDYPAGNGTSNNTAHTGYGFWAIPKVGATVLVFCLNADPRVRYYFASTLRLHRNRSMPAGRNEDFNGNKGPFGDAGDGLGNLEKIQPAYDNLREQFQGKIDTSIAKTRGFYERQIAQAKNEKDGKEGYDKNPADPSYLDPQTYCIVTPGRHAIIMQDEPKWSRLRLKTAEGHQIIFDDTNERIYVSTAKGKSWVELDQDGHIHVFGSETISVRAGKDINLYADRDINMEANRSFHVKANNGDIRFSTSDNFQVTANKGILMSACKDIDIDSEATIKITAANNFDMKAGTSLATTAGSSIQIHGGDSIIETARVIHLNGPIARQATKASCATKSQDPSVVPGHEPWDRPKSPQKRGPNWKE